MTASPPAPFPAWTYRAALCLFAVSGGCALVDEICWVRGLKVVFGSTIFSISAVLTVFMAGLGLGALFFGRRADRLARPWRTYARIELGIAATVIVTPWMFLVVDQLQQAVSWLADLPPYPRALVQAVPAMAVLLPPTFLMGGTLPVITRAARISLPQVGPRVAGLYAANIAGGVGGVLAANWLLVPHVGVRAALALSAVGNLAVATVALGLDRRARAGDSDDARVVVPAGPAPLDLRSGRSLRLLSLGFLLSGFSALALQVLWTRVLSWVLGSSVYSFALVLAAYLVGLAIGGAWIGRTAGETLHPLRWLFAFESVAALSAVFLVNAFGRLPPVYASVLMALQGQPALLEAGQFAIVLALLVVPTAAFGAIFPLFTHAIANATGRVGRGVGLGYFANTCGTILGSWSGGFLLIPWLGAQWSMLAMALLSLVVGLGVLAAATWPRPRKQALGAAAVAAFLALAVWAHPMDYLTLDTGVYIHGNLFFRLNEQPVSFTEGLYGNVSVYDLPNQRILKLDGKLQGSSGSAEQYTQLPLAYLPLCFVRGSGDALNIGLGTGITAGGLSLAPAVRSVTSVEIEPAVHEAAKLFRKWNHSFDTSPKMRVVLDDARHFCATTRQRFTVITSEPPNLWSQGSTQLFTVEAYRAFARVLAPGGVVCQWFHTLGMTDLELATALRSFAEVFPSVALFSYGPEAVLLLGSMEPLRPSPDAIRALDALADVREDLASLDFPSAASLLGNMALDDEQIRSLVSGAPRNTDDHPVLEFRIARQLWIPGSDVVERLRASGLPSPVERSILPSFAEDESARLLIGIAEARHRRNPARLAELAVEYLSGRPASEALLDQIRAGFEETGKPGAYLDCLESVLAERDDPLASTAAARMRYEIWKGAVSRLDHDSSRPLRELALEAARRAQGLARDPGELRAMIAEMEAARP